MRVFGSSGIDIGILDVKDDGLIKLESKKPILVRPGFVLKGETGADVLDLTGEFRRFLNEANKAQTRGANGESRGALLVFIDEDKYENAFRVTGTYAEENEIITLSPFLWKENQPTALEKITGKDANEVAKKLLEAVLLKIENQ